MDLQIPMQSVTITTKVVSSNTANGTRVLDTTLCDVYFSDLRQVGDFVFVLRFFPPIKLTATKQQRYS